MEPVYSIVLAIVLLGEQRELEPLHFYLGVAIIMAVVFSHPLLMRRQPRYSDAATAGRPGRDKNG